MDEASQIREILRLHDWAEEERASTLKSLKETVETAEEMARIDGNQEQVADDPKSLASKHETNENYTEAPRQCLEANSQDSKSRSILLARLNILERK